jgi:hypothetical protein
MAPEGRIWTGTAGFLTPRTGDRRPRSRPDRPADPVGARARPRQPIRADTTDRDRCPARARTTRATRGMRFSDASSPYRFPDPLPHAGIFRMSRTESRHPMSEVCRPLPAGRTNRAWPSRLDRPRCSAAPSCASERARRPLRPALGACRRAIESDFRAAGTVEGAGHGGATGPPSGRPAWCSAHAVYHDRDRGPPAQIPARIPGRHRRPYIPREPIPAPPGEMCAQCQAGQVTSGGFVLAVAASDRACHLIAGRAPH